jgi:hypothetical protein
MSHPTITKSGALLHAHRQSSRRGHTRRGERRFCRKRVLDQALVTGAIVGARTGRQVQGNVGAAELYLTDKEIAGIGERNPYRPELVMAV